MLHVVGDERLGDRERGEIPDDDAKEQNRHERNEGDTNRDQITFHKVSLVLTVIALNLNDEYPSLDRFAPDFEAACSLQILQSSHRPR